MSVIGSEGLQLPLSPRDEGYLLGLTTPEDDQYTMHFDGADHEGLDIPDDVHPALAEHPDFLDGVGQGVALRRKLSEMGYSILRQESREELLAGSHGGTD